MAAFAAGWDILEVQSGWRGRGLGKLLVQSRLQAACEAGLPGVLIECKPHTSVPFWRAMGFQIVNEGAVIRGYRLFRRHQSLKSSPVSSLRITLMKDGCPHLQPFVTRVGQVDSCAWELETAYSEYVPSLSGLKAALAFDGQEALVHYSEWDQFGLERDLPFVHMDTFYTDMLG